MEIRGFYQDEAAELEQAGKAALGAQFRWRIELRVLRDNPRVFFPVALVGTKIVGMAVAELREDEHRAVGTVRLVVSFVVEGMVDRAVKLALLSRLEQKFKDLDADEIEVRGDQDLNFLVILERAGYRMEVHGGEPLDCDGPTRRRLVKPLRSVSHPWAARSTPGQTGPRMVQ